MKPWELGYLVPSFLRAGDNLGDYRRLFYGPGDGFQNNPGFPRMNMRATPAFEGWGDPSRILGAMGSTGIGTRAHMRQKRQKPVKLD